MKHKLTLVLLSFFLGVQCMVAQQMKVTGVVINEDDGEPVIGASIVVKGTTIGTITDLDGKFELETQKDAKLIISYVGLRTQETTAQQNMRIVLSSDSQAIDEVVVVAYGTAKKSSFTGSASTVGAALMDKRPLSNALRIGRKHFRSTNDFLYRTTGRSCQGNDPWFWFSKRG